MYKEEDFLQLSGIQHFEFCRRQWALAYIELQWQENVRTVEGKILHENAHDVSVKEKRGKPKTDDSDILQVTAQALCLEEMLCCTIPYGYIYYGETKHRAKVEFTDEIRDKVRKIFAEMHKYYAQCYTPKVKISKKCNACSLKDICLPVLNKKKSVSGYIDKIISEEEKE